MNSSSLDKKLSFKKNVIIIFLVSLYTFLSTYFAYHNSVNYELNIIVKDVLFSLLALFYGIFFKNLKQFVFVCFIYSFSGYCDPINNPANSYILTFSALLLSVLLHLVLYRKKLHINDYTFSLLALFLCFGIGGLFSKDPDFILDSQKNLTIIFRISILFIFLVVFVISNYTKIKFEEIAISFSLVNLLICIEIIVEASKYIDNFEIFMSQNFYLIWGMKNTICIPIMMTLPFVIWFIFNDSKKRIFYIILSILNIFCVFLMFSRTAFIFFIPEFLLMLAGGIFIKSKINFKKVLKGCLVGLLVVIAVVVLFSIVYKDEIYQMFTSGNFFRSDTFISRIEIWERVMEIYHNNQWFGIGYIGSFNFHFDVWGDAYQAVHQTIFQVLYLSGNIGLIIFMYHIYTKYTKLLYKFNFNKFTIFVSYLGAAAIGLVDITYFQTIFLLTLIPLMIYTESIIDNDKAIYLF